MKADRVANRLLGAVESLLEPGAHNKRSASPQVNKRAARGPASGNAERLRDFLSHADRDSRHGKTQRQRFWDKVARTPGCWFWTSAHNRQGYGQFFWRGRAIPAHRIAYALSFGVPPDGALVCHSCDCRPCVNPIHLWVGTVSANQQDMVRKGRHPETVLKAQLRLESA